MLVRSRLNQVAQARILSPATVLGYTRLLDPLGLRDKELGEVTVYLRWGAWEIYGPGR
jgi:hypothetical protein